jgi:hypothetical protein
VEIGSLTSIPRRLRSVTTFASALTAGAEISGRAIGDGAAVSVVTGPLWSWPQGAGTLPRRTRVEAA